MRRRVLIAVMLLVSGWLLSQSGQMMPAGQRETMRPEPFKEGLDESGLLIEKIEAEHPLMVLASPGTGVYRLSFPDDVWPVGEPYAAGLSEAASASTRWGIDEIMSFPHMYYELIWKGEVTFDAGLHRYYKTMRPGQSSQYEILINGYVASGTSFGGTIPPCGNRFSLWGCSSIAYFDEWFYWYDEYLADGDQSGLYYIPNAQVSCGSFLYPKRLFFTFTIPAGEAGMKLKGDFWITGIFAHANPDVHCQDYECFRSLNPVFRPAAFQNYSFPPKVFRNSSPCFWTRTSSTIVPYVANPPSCSENDYYEVWIRITE